MSEDFYKMDPRAWNAGTEPLTTDQIGCLLLFCHWIYIHKEDVPADVSLLGRIWKCHPNKARAMLVTLTDAGKINLTRDGRLTNTRARRELDERETRTRHRSHAAKTGSRHKADPRETQGRHGEDGSKNINEINSDDEHMPLPKRREEERRGDKREMDSPSNTACLSPPEGGPLSDDRFDEIDGQPIGMDDLAGLEAFDPSSYGQFDPDDGVYPVEESTPKPARRGLKRATAIDPSWQPGDKEREAWSKHGLPIGRLDHEWSQFKNFHESRGNLMKSWSAAWRTWVGKALERSPQAAVSFGEERPKVDRYNKNLSKAGTRVAV